MSAFLAGGVSGKPRAFFGVGDVDWGEVSETDEALLFRFRSVPTLLIAACKLVLRVPGLSSLFELRSSWLILLPCLSRYSSGTLQLRRKAVDLCGTAGGVESGKSCGGGGMERKELGD